MSSWPIPRRALGGYPAGIEEGDQLRVAGADLIRAVAEDVRRGVAPPVVAARFHHGVADAIARTCAILRSRTGLGVVALSGGVFQNLLLLDRTVSRLEARRLPGPRARAGAAQRRRDQPRPGGRGRRP